MKFRVSMTKKCQKSFCKVQSCNFEVMEKYKKRSKNELEQLASRTKSILKNIDIPNEKVPVLRHKYFFNSLNNCFFRSSYKE